MLNWILLNTILKLVVKLLISLIIYGEELIIVAKKDLAFLNFSLRFHVTPEGKLIQTQGGDILLSVDNQGWRFKSSHPVKIEESLLQNVLINNFRNKQIQSISDFENYFLKIGINPDSIKKKITIEVLWNQLIYSKYIQSVKIDKKKN